MLELALLLLFLLAMSKIQIGGAKLKVTKEHEKKHEEKFIEDKAWQFKTLDDCMEFRELRQTGWKGNAEDFYRWKYEE